VNDVDSFSRLLERRRLVAMRRPGLMAILLLAGCGSHERVPIGRDDAPQQPANRCAIAGADPLEQALLGPSDRSHWLQPWRAFRDTWPASRMLASPGYQAPFPPDPSWVSAFSSSGFRHVTVEVGWGRLTYDGEPSALSGQLQGALDELASQALQVGLRPLLLLNAPGISSPSKVVSLTLSEPARLGARSLRLLPQDAVQLVAHKAVLAGDAPSLVDAVAADGTVSLSRPLSRDLAAGPVEFTLLRYAPFSRPRLLDGSANPEFEETLTGWLAYLGAVASQLRSDLGSEEFDIELWNETSPGNNYEVFDINTFYEPPLEPGRPGSFDENLDAIRERSISWLRAPERGLTKIGVSDGSGNMRFAVASSNEPAGITALSRHVSAQGKRFPENAALGATPSIDASGADNGKLEGDVWVEAFTPTYDALFPEQALTALYPPDARRPGQIARDLSPVSSLDARGVQHGRGPLVAGVPLPDVWLTALSTNLGLSQELGLSLSAADRLHLQAKALLRSFSAYVGAGAGLVSIYGPDVDTVRYFDLTEPGGGEALTALGRFFARFKGDSEPASVRALELVSVSACASGREFSGDGSAGRPDLDHRRLVTFFPFQLNSREFLVPSYVMTRNLLQVHGSGSAPDRFDLPPQSFELTVRGLAPATARATLFDPLSNATRAVPLRSVGSDVVLSVELTDYPVLLELGD
jgi:hypothetical protein